VTMKDEIKKLKSPPNQPTTKDKRTQGKHNTLRN